MSKHIIGRVDKIDFPKLGLFNIDVKIDTGAYTSAIHCSEIIVEDHSLRCIFNSDVHQNFGKTEIVFNEYSRTNVKSSNGYKENRYKVKSEVVFFGKTYKINLTLSTRDDMKFPVLIGRQFLKQKFIVDVDLENVSYLYKIHNEYSNTI
ncbi:RimK/LysX family protein [Sabulilitoribacter multivorans]|uniref:RimK/LysX family protein n=1 Tax=Flaviramulus multivorans TaxID=1304750 RepID=A0ABS9IHA6_9FLAO|nr:RimK/LysX family protein [Flaviramulus multivorans]MCF7559763.1 RimK/LysX family protein [Flaviramulus multivorans]